MQASLDADDQVRTKGVEGFIQLQVYLTQLSACLDGIASHLAICIDRTLIHHPYTGHLLARGKKIGISLSSVDRPTSI